MDFNRGSGVELVESTSPRILELGAILVVAAVIDQD